MSLLVQTVPSNVEHLFRPSKLSAIGKLPLKSRARLSENASAAPSATPHGVNGSNGILLSSRMTTTPQKQSIAMLLGPGTGLDHALKDFKASYETITKAFSGLFSYPYLETLQAPAIDAAQAKDTNTFATKGTESLNTREFLMRGNSNFRIFADTEVTLCRNLRSYGLLLDTLLKQQTVSAFVKAMSPVVTKYSKQLDDISVDKEESFTQLYEFVVSLNSSVSSTNKQIDTLSRSIELRQTELDDLNVTETLTKLLGSIFKFASGGGDAATQLGVLLGLGSEFLQGNFKSLYANETKLKAVIANLKSLRAKLTSINVNLTALATAVANTVEANVVMSSVWSTIAERLKELSTMPGIEEKLSDEQLVNLQKSWKPTRDNAEELVAALTGAINASMSVLSARNNETFAPNASISFPQTANELHLYGMARETGADGTLNLPQYFNVIRGIASNQLVVNRVQEKFKLSMNAQMMMVGDGDKTPEEKLAEKIGYLGPPQDVLDSLDKLSGDCIAVKKTFQVILTTPSLDSLQILNPFKTADTPNEPQDLDLRSIIVRYQTMYNDLQNSSMDCVRRLISYSALQKALLPHVTAFDPVDKTQVKLEAYLKACKKVVDGYQEEATSLSARYTKFGQDWQLARDNLEERINKCSENAANAKRELEQAKEKYENDTLKGVFGIFGALALFAIGAFTLPLGILAIAAGGALLGVSIKTLVERNQLTEAIQSFQTAIDTANKTKEALVALRQPMTDVATAVTALSKIWSDMAQNLTDIQTFMLTWAPGDVIFELTVQNVIDAWTNIKDLCQKYIDIISGAAPIT